MFCCRYINVNTLYEGNDGGDDNDDDNNNNNNNNNSKYI
jgi:hypothetical protein